MKTLSRDNLEKKARCEFWFPHGVLVAVSNVTRPWAFLPGVVRVGLTLP